jgi:hypothetical protein
MRGEVAYRVYGVHAGREKDTYLGAFRTVDEAQAMVAQLQIRDMNGENWAMQYHDKGFEIRKIEVTTEFEIPSLPKPRDKFVIKTSAKPNQPGTWDSTRVEVFRRNISADSIERICEYERNHAMFQTFEPFRQGGREYALISRDYTMSAVLDLASGKVIAEEVQDGSSGDGFCPAGFYVPDWWDVNDGSIIPGSEFWGTDDEWPIGHFGFVWGCNWGDDSSWKVQYLDLSDIQQGRIIRSERFAYVELDTSGFESPCIKLDIEAQTKTAPPHFIRLSRNKGITTVTFSVEMTFNLESGESIEWRRLKIAHLE